MPKQSIDETGKSQNALKKLMDHAETHHFRSQIYVYDKGGDTQLLELDNVLTTILFDSNSFKISIQWEDAGFTREGFREMDLYGVYHASYTPMTFSKGKLTIKADRKIIIEP